MPRLWKRFLGTDPSDYLIMNNTTENEHYIQCYYCHTDDNYHIEMRRGDPDHN